jgi:hypothetical protein
MSYRLVSVVSLVLAGFAASTGVSFAAIDDQDEVMIVTGITIAVFLVIVSALAFLKHLAGLDRMPPPEPDAGDHGGHH